MIIIRTERFKKSWQLLGKEQRKLAGKAILKMTTNLSYPALGVKKLKGTAGIWEARVNLSLRITFQMKNDVIVLRNIGTHDDTLRRP